jgi:hypothetical protein
LLTRNSDIYRERGLIGTGFAYLDENGKLKGLGKQIVEGEADISIMSSEIMPFRLEKLTFLFATEDERYIDNDIFNYIQNLNRIEDSKLSLVSIPVSTPYSTSSMQVQSETFTLYRSLGISGLATPPYGSLLL